MSTDALAQGLPDLVAAVERLDTHMERCAWHYNGACDCAWSAAWKVIHDPDFRKALDAFLSEAKSPPSGFFTTADLAGERGRNG